MSAETGPPHAAADHGAAMAPSTVAHLDLAALSLGNVPAVFFDLLALPRSLALDILARLPFDTRLRCIEVSRAWRALLSDTSLWSYLKLSDDFGVARFSVSLFRAAVAKAGGQLRTLDVTGKQVHHSFPDDKPLDTSRLLFSVLHDVVVANAATLVELRLSNSFIHVDKLTALCQSAPSLTVLSDAWCESVDEVNTLLLKQEHFSNLQLTQLWVRNAPELTGDDAVSSFAKLLVEHGHTLTKLSLDDAPLNTAAAMGAIVDAAITLHLSELQLKRCRATPTTVPALTRLVAAGWLRDLDISNDSIALFEEGADATRLFCDAVRASSLKRYELDGVGDVHELEELEAFFPSGPFWFWFRALPE